MTAAALTGRRAATHTLTGSPRPHDLQRWRERRRCLWPASFNSPPAPGAMDRAHVSAYARALQLVRVRSLAACGLWLFLLCALWFVLLTDRHPQPQTPQAHTDTPTDTQCGRPPPASCPSSAAAAARSAATAPLSRGASSQQGACGDWAMGLGGGVVGMGMKKGPESGLTHVGTQCPYTHSGAVAARGRGRGWRRISQVRA